MKRHLAAGWMVAAAVVAAGVFAGPRLLDAQQGKPTGPRVIVVNDVAHVVSKRLDSMKPIPPAYGLRRQIALRHAHPVRSAVQPTAPDPALQTSAGPLVSTTSSGQNFTGVGVGLNGFSPGYAPPDTNGSAGATQYVQWVNVNFAIFDKGTGAVTYGPAAGNTLWGPLGGACASNNSGDPIAQYDKQANRWVMLQPVFKSPYYLCVAVSTTSDATGSYNLYQFPISNGHFPDYPKLAVWPDGYYVSYNDFGNGGNNYSGAYACALDRSAMLQGNSATMQCFNSGTSNFSLLPADLDGDSVAPGATAAPPANAPEDFIAMDYGTLNALEVFNFHVDWSNPSNSTFTGPSVIPVASISEACGGGTCIPQSGTSTQLDSLGDRLMYRFAYRNFGGYQSWVVSQSVATGSGNITGIRWYELRNSNQGSTPTLYQQGTFAPDSNYRWMPSIAEDESGDIAVGYSVSSGTMNPAIRFTGRVPTDQPGGMESENTIIQGGGSQTSNLTRWGDYSNMSVDPTDDCTFWYTTEYERSNGSFNWSTQIASFTFPGCGTTATPDFSLSGSPSSQTVTQGNSTTYTISVTPSNSYTGKVNLSVTTPSPLPTGMTASFSPNPADITGTSAVDSTLSVTTTSSTPTGTYNLTVSGDDGTTTHATQVSVVVQAPPDFSVSGTPSSSTVTAGNNTTYTIGVTPANDYSGNVNLSVTNSLPTGMTVGFSPNPAVVSGTSTVNSTLTVSTTASTPASTYNLTVSGTDGTTTHTTQVSITVQAPPPPDFSLSSSPSSQTVTQGSPASYTIGVTPSGGFAGTVALSATGLPTGATASFNPVSVDTSGGAGTSALTVSTSGSLAAGTYNFNVVGTSGSLNHSIPLTLTVQQQASSDFTVSATPSISSATQGSSTAYTVTVGGSGTGPFNGTVNLSVSGVPSRTSASFNTTSITGSGSATLTVSPHHNAKNGTYTLTITGTSGSLSHSATVTFVIGTIASPAFSVSASPSSQTVAPGGVASYTVTVTPSNGYTGNVGLSVTGAPTGATAGISPSSVSITSSSAASSTLTVNTGTSTPGTYTLTVTGNDGATSHSTTVTLVVGSSGGSGDFSLSATAPGPLTAKSSTSSTITITPSGGFNGSVNLSVSGLPHGTNATFNPSTATTSSTLAISAGGHPQTGSYKLTITGTSGSLSHSTTVTLTVN